MIHQHLVDIIGARGILATLRGAIAVVHPDLVGVGARSQFWNLYPDEGHFINRIKFFNVKFQRRLVIVRDETNIGAILKRVEEVIKISRV